MSNKKKRYPVERYIICMLITVVALVLLSYFVQKRNSNQQISEYGELHETQIEKINQLLDDHEARISKLEHNS